MLFIILVVVVFVVDAVVVDVVVVNDDVIDVFRNARESKSCPQQAKPVLHICTTSPDPSFSIIMPTSLLIRESRTSFDDITKFNNICSHYHISFTSCVQSTSVSSYSLI